MPDRREVITVFVLVDKPLPTDHSFISGVIEKQLPQNNCRVVFVGFGVEGTFVTGNSNLKYVLINPRFSNFFLKKIEKLVRFINLIRRQKVRGVLLTRNDPVYLVVGKLLRILGCITGHIHQISHLHSFSTTERTSTVYKLKSWGDRLLSNTLLPSVDKVLVISEAMRTFLEQRWSFLPTKYLVFPLGIDADDFPATVPPLAARPRDIIYIGTTAKSRKLEVILEAVQQYRRQYGEIVLDIYGRSHDPEDDVQWKHWIAKNKLEDTIILHGRIPRREVLAKLLDTKIGLSTIPAYGLLKQISPTKLMEYLGAGCAVVATRGIPEQEEIVTQSNGGELVNFSAGEIASGIHEILSDPTAYQARAVTGRTYILKERSYREMGEKLAKVLHGISGVERKSADA